MKKILVVLSVMVLVAGFAFASITGSVVAKYGFDFTEGTVGYSMEGNNAKFSFTLSTDSGSSTGENKPYATVTVGFGVSGSIAKNENEVLTWDKDDGYKFALAANERELGFKLNLSDFRIVGENWELNFLAAMGAGDFAKSAWEVDATDDHNPIDMDWKFSKEEGVTLTYDDYKVGIYAKAKDEKTTVDVRTETKEFTFADSITAKVGFAAGITQEGDDDAKFNFGASVKGGYKTDALTADVAADFQNYDEQFDTDVALDVVYNFLTFNGYYATRVSKASQRFQYVTANLKTAEDILSLRAIVDVAKIAENVPVKATIYAENLINDAKFFGLKEEGTFGKIKETLMVGFYPVFQRVEALEKDGSALTLNVGGSYDVNDAISAALNVGYVNFGSDSEYLQGSRIAFKVGATYTHEKFTATANLYGAKDTYGVKENPVDGTSRDEEFLISGDAEISSDKIVENATLSAKLVFDENGAISAYKFTANENQKLDLTPSKKTNSLTLSCKVSF